MKAIIIQASPADEAHTQKIVENLEKQGVPYEIETGSAHKETKKILEVLEKHAKEKVVYITIAGRSNALSGVVAANTASPVIACPPFADKMDMMVNIQSTLQMPSNVAVLTILDPGNCALAVKKIFELHQ